MAHGYRFPYLVWSGHRNWNSASRGSEFSVFLYDDEADDPDQDAWMDAIDTEPTDGNYTRQSFTWGGHSVDSYSTEVGVYFGDVTYDITNTTGEVDSFGLVATLEYFNGMGRDSTYSPGDMVDVFIGSGPLEERVDLSKHSGNWTVEAGATLTAMY